MHPPGVMDIEDATTIVANIGMAMSWTSIGVLDPRKCGQRIDLHVLSGCDTVSYPFRKGKKSTLNLLDIDIYDHVLGQAGITHSRLNATADSFFLLFYGQNSCVTKNDARACVFCGREKTHH